MRKFMLGICIMLAWYLYVPSSYNARYERIAVTDHGVEVSDTCRRFTRVSNGKFIYACGTFYIVQE